MSARRLVTHGRVQGMNRAQVSGLWVRWILGAVGFGVAARYPAVSQTQ